jgi:gamma-glutamyl hercynylcysteine S-oxide synthase
MINSNKRMNIFQMKWFPISIILLISFYPAHSQGLNSLRFEKASGLSTAKVIILDSIPVLFKKKPLFSFLLNNRKYNSADVNSEFSGSGFSQFYSNSLSVTFRMIDSISTGVQGEIVFENRGSDTIAISNVLPFGEDDSSVYITGYGPPDLARAWLFRPGVRPVRVILPDNAWELGYSSFNTGSDVSLCALIRRGKNEGGQSKRYETVLPPEAKVTYSFYADIFTGEWQNGLRLIFRDRNLYDVENFDNSMYEREDLLWIKKSYLIILQMAWDREFYDRFTGRFTYPEVIKKGMDLFGNIDVYGIWPTWPRLGLDPRNQWDLYRDLPGGTNQLRSFIRMSQQSGTKVFIAYNPWDSKNGKENDLNGMAKLLADTEADGVVLDTRGSSGIEIQMAADTVKNGVVMYSEGMAVPRDMQGIISGRVHNALYLSPELNLNKFIKPDFSIFRVCDVGEGPIHREIAIAFFNGYGTELNLFRSGGRNEKYIEGLNFLAGTTFILRQNNDAFLDHGWTPMLETTHDNVFVNKWNSADKTIFTVLNMKPEGFNGTLFKVRHAPDKHYVSLWNHENIIPEVNDDTVLIRVKAPGWYPEYSGTRLEGSVDCIAEFPVLIKSHLKGDSLTISNSGSGKIFIWKGDPSYQSTYKEFRSINDTTLSVKDLFGYYEGKIVIQLLENETLKDENILTFKGGKPWLISKVIPTEMANEIPADMVLVPGASFSFNVSGNDEFIAYPEINGNIFNLDSFLIDRYPVTNAQFYEFLIKSNYWPADTARFLKHWQSGMFKQGQDKYPVVYVSLEDMKAYAKWAEKRLPTQAEWQLAAQGPDKRIWPWGNEFHGTFCNNSFNRPTPVDAFMKGVSPYGVADMVGNIWQMTNDTYFNGSNYFNVIRGGSYYRPGASSWYLQGGPQPLNRTQIMLLVSQGFDRSSTVGFRCVKDINTAGLKNK